MSTVDNVVSKLMRMTPHKANAGIYAHELGHIRSSKDIPASLRKLWHGAYGYGPLAGSALNTGLNLAALRKLEQSRALGRNTSGDMLLTTNNPSRSRTRLARALGVVDDLFGDPASARKAYDPEAIRAAGVRAGWRAGAVSGVANLPRLIEEARATSRGLRGLRMTRMLNPKGYSKAKRDLALAYSTYLLGAGLNVAGEVMTARSVVGAIGDRGTARTARTIGFVGGLLLPSILKHTIKSSDKIGPIRRKILDVAIAKDPFMLNAAARTVGASPLGSFALPFPVNGRLSRYLAKKQLGQIVHSKDVDKLLGGGIHVPLELDGIRGRLLDAAEAGKKRALAEKHPIKAWLGGYET